MCPGTVLRPQAAPYRHHRWAPVRAHHLPAQHTGGVGLAINLPEQIATTRQSQPGNLKPQYSI